MAYTHTSPGVTGTSTTAKVFKNSGIRSATKGDTCLNPAKGHVYKCDTGGGPNAAKWKYLKTVILEKPGQVAVSAPKRGDGRKMEGKWTTPKTMLSKYQCSRAEELYVKWTLDVKGKDLVDIDKKGNLDHTSDSINLNSFTATKTGTTYTRASFYPVTDLWLRKVTLTVTAHNSKGNGKPASAVYEFDKPRVPTLSATSIDANGVVSCTVTTDAGTDKREVYRTRYQVDVYDSSGAKKWVPVQDSYQLISTSTTKTLTREVTNWQVAGKYVLVRFRAQAQGFAGDSDWSAYKTHVVGWPNAATIDAKNVKVPGRTSTDIATFPISVNNDTNHKTDRVVLQKLANVTASTAAAATAMTGSWEDTSYEDNGNCTALACTVADIACDEGKWSWVRVKSWHDIEGIFFTYSEPYRVDALHRAAPTAADDPVDIVSIAQGTTGETLNVTMGWNADGTDDADGTELSWSADSDSWDSTDRPDAFEFPNSESEGQLVVDNKTYRGSRKLVVKKLAEGEPTYFRARRYKDNADGNRGYGPYCDVKSGIPTVAPSDVVLMADKFVAAGSDIPFSWAFAGGGTQRSWALVDNSTKSIIAEGTDSHGSTVVDSARAASFAVSGTLTAFVRVSTGGAPVASATRSIEIVQAPTLTLGAISTLTAQPLSISLTCDMPGCAASIVVGALGGQALAPDGFIRQPAGDAVWSGYVHPAWALSNGSYTATVVLPTALAFHGGLNYYVTAVAVDESTALTSAQARAEFAVTWASPAPEPPSSGYVPTADQSIVSGKQYYTYDPATGDYDEVETPVAADLPNYYEGFTGIEVTPSVIEDDDGRITRSCSIALMAPDGAPSGSVYDIYRLTFEGPRLVGSGYPLDATVTDRYAPFGDCSNAYRVCLRTPDGDMAWADYDYQLEGYCLRFDWEGYERTQVELPYGIDLSDVHSKRFAEHVHLDGSRGGGWNDGAGRTGSLTTDIIRLEDPEKVAAVYDMAQHAGPVLVRTPNGSCYEANVDMDTAGLSDSHQVLACSFTATEIDLTRTFMLDPVNVESMDTTTTTQGA